MFNILKHHYYSKNCNFNDIMLYIFNQLVLQEKQTHFRKYITLNLGKMKKY